MSQGKGVGPVFGQGQSPSSPPPPASDESHRQRAQFIKVGQYIEFCGERCEVIYTSAPDVDLAIVLRIRFNDGVHDISEISIVLPSRTLLKVRDSI